MQDSMFTFDASTREILEQAIRNELTTLVYLEQLTERVNPAEDRAVLRDLVTRKHEHLSHFERRFHEIFGTAAPDLPRPEIAGSDVTTPMTLSRALKRANERERDLESNWRFLAEQVSGPEQRALLLELAETQWRFREEVNQIQARLGAVDDFLDF